MLNAAKTTDGRSKRWEAHNARRRVEMLDAAIATIEAEGIEVSVRQIAERLGVPRPVVYRHFNGRQDLDEQVRGRILEMLLSELEPTLRPDGTVRQTIRRAVGTYLRWIERHPRLHHFLGTGPHRERGGGSRVVAGARSAIGGQLSELLAAALRGSGKDTAPARPMAFGVIGLVDGAVNSWRSDADSTLTAHDLEALLSESIVTLFVSNARLLGITIDPDTPASTLIGG